MYSIEKKETSNHDLSPGETLEALATKRFSRRDLLGWVGQGALSIGAFAFFSRTTLAAEPRTKLERMLPGAHEIHTNALGLV